MHSDMHYVSKDSIRTMVYETCEAIYFRLHSTSFPVITRGKWLQISGAFENAFGIPHVIGAVDGKLVETLKPPNSGSLYYAYKGIRA